MEKKEEGKTDKKFKKLERMQQKKTNTQTTQN